MDAATSVERQKYVFSKVCGVLFREFKFDDKDNARGFFYSLRQLFIDWNYKGWNSEEFKAQEQVIDKQVGES